MNINRVASHDCREKLCGVCEKQANVWNPEKFSIQVLDADYFLGWCSFTTLEVTPKNRVEFVPLETNEEDELTSFEQEIVTKAERRLVIKTDNHVCAHSRCGICGRRDCFWHMGGYWKNYQDKPSKLHK
jgi:hypothetical protein